MSAFIDRLFRVLAVGLLVVSGCGSTQTGSNGSADLAAFDIGGTPVDGGGGDMTCVVAATPMLDVLLLIDNSPSMIGKQAAFIANISQLVDAIDALKVDYHIGVATSDVGAWAAPNMPFPMPLGIACDSFAGDDGVLQRVPCTSRSFLISADGKACAAACPDPSLVPGGGQGFVSKDAKGVTNVPKNDITGALKCIGLLGETGCGIEGQLEGAKRALDGHNAGNAGFLRSGSVLAVLFLTDEDDCSVALARRTENTPATMDCPQGMKDAPFNCFNPDFRCIARDVQCDAPLNVAGGPEVNCSERDPSYLDPVKKYVDFFAGLRDPQHLIVAGIWTPKASPFLVVQTSNLGGTSASLNRSVGAQAACVNAMDATIYGRPQFRLSKFAAQIDGSIEANVCDIASYRAVFTAIANQVVAKVHCGH